MKPTAFLMLCLAVLSAFPDRATAYSAKPASTYYVRLQVISSCGTIIASNLEMTPSDEEYRTNRFSRIRVVGYSDENYGEKDIDSSAKHDAISKLLTRFGLTSIASKREIVNYTTSDMTIMNYEGAIKYPFSIVKRGYVNNGSVYRVVMEADFAPIALPSEWSLLYWKAAIKQSAKDVFTLLYKGFP